LTHPLSQSVEGCTLHERREPYHWAPDTWRWLVTVDAHDVEERTLQVEESRLIPLPYPGMTGVAYVGPPKRVRRRRTTSNARTASA